MPVRLSDCLAPLLADFVNTRFIKGSNPHDFISYPMSQELVDLCATTLKHSPYYEELKQSVFQHLSKQIKTLRQSDEYKAIHPELFI